MKYLFIALFGILIGIGHPVHSAVKPALLMDVIGSPGIAVGGVSNDLEVFLSNSSDSKRVYFENTHGTSINAWTLMSAYRLKMSPKLRFLLGAEASYIVKGTIRGRWTDTNIKDGYSLSAVVGASYDILDNVSCRVVFPFYQYSKAKIDIPAGGTPPAGGSTLTSYGWNESAIFGLVMTF